MVVLATDIDIGQPAIDRDITVGIYTLVDKINPANASGTIISVEIWCATALENCEVATFYVVDGNNLSTRDTQAIGAVTAGSKQTFGVDLSVEEGDFIGMYYTAGVMEKSTGANGYWFFAGDLIPCTDQTFAVSSTGDAVSLYGAGTTSDIDIGSPAIDRNSQYSAPRTVVNKNNPANETGKITNIEIYVNVQTVALQVATFFIVSGNNLSTRDYQDLGVLATGYHSIAVDLDVEVGDYIGYWEATGQVDVVSTGGTGCWAIATDQIPCTNVEFALDSGGDNLLSLSGTGETVAAGIKWNGVTITKWNGQVITKWNGLE